MATSTNAKKGTAVQTKNADNDDFVILGDDPKDKQFVRVRIQASNSKELGNKVVGAGEFSLPKTTAPYSAWEKQFGGEEEFKLNALRNLIVTIRASLKSQGKKVGRGGLAAKMRG